LHPDFYRLISTLFLPVAVGFYLFSYADPFLSRVVVIHWPFGLRYLSFLLLAIGFAFGYILPRRGSASDRKLEKGLFLVFGLASLLTPALRPGHVAFLLLLGLGTCTGVAAVYQNGRSLQQEGQPFWNHWSTPFLMLTTLLLLGFSLLLTLWIAHFGDWLPGGWILPRAKNILNAGLLGVVVFSWARFRYILGMSLVIPRALRPFKFLLLARVLIGVILPWLLINFTFLFLDETSISPILLALLFTGELVDRASFAAVRIN